MTPVNTVDSLVMKAWTCPHVQLDFPGELDQLWLDALPDASNDSHG